MKVATNVPVLASPLVAVKVGLPMRATTGIASGFTATVKGMDLPQEPLDRIRENAALVLAKHPKSSGHKMGFDSQSVEWLEGFIERARHAEPDTTKKLTSVFGSYLGEAIIAAAGGQWARDDDGVIGIDFGNGGWCYPFNKVAKQFENGTEGGDGIGSFYDVCVNFVATGELGAMTKGEE